MFRSQSGAQNGRVTFATGSNRTVSNLQADSLISLSILHPSHNAGHKHRFAKWLLAGQMDGWMDGYTTLAVYFNVLGDQSCY